MLTSISVTVSNNPYEGGVFITSVGQIEEIGDITAINISRKISSSSSWTTIHTVSVESVDDLDFELFDPYVINGKTYTYNFDVMHGDYISEMDMVENVSCVFNGLYVGNNNKHYVAYANFKTEIKRNTVVNYVSPISGKYPQRVSNADLNYTTGTSSGLFLKLTDDKKQFVKDLYSERTQEIIDFLCDGTSKIIKTHDGKIFNVGIDSSVTEVYNEFWGINEIEFSWTEIGDVPKFGLVVV